MYSKENEKTTLKLEIPSGHFCKDCKFLMQSNLQDGGTNQCKIFDCVLGNKLTDIFKCPMCIAQSQLNGPTTRGI